MAFMFRNNDDVADKDIPRPAEQRLHFKQYSSPEFNFVKGQ